MSVKRQGRDPTSDYRYLSGITKNSNDILLKQVNITNKITNPSQIYGRNREKFSAIDRNRYNLHKKPSSRNRKFLEEDKPSKIKLTRNVKKELNGSAFSYMESRDLSRHSNSLSRNFKDFSLSPGTNKRTASKDPTPKPTRNTAKNNSGHYRNQSIHIYREPNIKKDSSLTIKKNRALSINKIEVDSLNYRNNLNESCPLSKMLMKEKQSKIDREKRDRNNDEEQMKELMILYKKKDYEGAISYGEEILAKQPSSVNTLYVMGLSACMLHRHELTISSFKKILNVDPLYKKNMYLFISIAYKKMNDQENAIGILTEAINHFPNFYEAYIYRGKLYLKKKDLKNSINDFTTSIELNSAKCSGYIG